jgi:hypothetical protein
MSDGVVYQKNGLKIIAFEVDHGDSSSRPAAIASNTQAASP